MKVICNWVKVIKMHAGDKLTSYLSKTGRIAVPLTPENNKIKKMRKSRETSL